MGEEEKEITEGVKVSIEETPEESKEITFSVNTSQSGVASYVSDIIQGKLDCVIISTTKQVEVRISIDGYDIELFSIVSLSGDNYLPLRVSALSDKGEMFRDSPEGYCLNDRLKFEVNGPLNTDVSFVVRFR